jgi:hypothetical protein
MPVLTTVVDGIPRFYRITMAHCIPVLVQPTQHNSADPRKKHSLAM